MGKPLVSALLEASDSSLEYIPIYFSIKGPVAIQEVKSLSDVDKRLMKRGLGAPSNIWKARTFLSGSIRDTSRVQLCVIGSLLCI